jgi:hypothetical protein
MIALRVALIRSGPCRPQCPRMAVIRSRSKLRSCKGIYELVR